MAAHSSDFSLRRSERGELLALFWRQARWRLRRSLVGVAARLRVVEVRLHAPGPTLLLWAPAGRA